MTLFAFGPDVYDIPHVIADLLKPLQERGFKCDENAAENIWRLLKRYDPREFYYHDLDREHHLGGRGVEFVRKAEAAELTHRVFTAVFGEVDFKHVKDTILGPTLCEAASLPSNVSLSIEDLEKGMRFFREWYCEVQKLL